MLGGAEGTAAAAAAAAGLARTSSETRERAVVCLNIIAGLGQVREVWQGIRYAVTGVERRPLLYIHSRGWRQTSTFRGVDGNAPAAQHLFD